MKEINTIRLSHIIHEKTPSYGNRDTFTDTLNSSLKNGDKAETSKWVFTNNHFGTHVDAPSHFILNGKTITDFKPEFWVFRKVTCIELPVAGPILIDDGLLSKHNIPEQTELLLIKTGYELFRNTQKYWEENPGISASAGNYLKRSFPFLRAVGFDFISVTSFQHRKMGREAHLALLAGNQPIIPIEDMSLKLVSSSIPLHDVIVSPIFVRNANGAPATIYAHVSE